MRKVYECLSLGIIYGFIYNIIEILYRGYSHWTMWILAGIIGIFIGLYNDTIEYSVPIEVQAIYGMAIATSLEYFCGCIVNLQLGWKVWDYSNIPFNLNGQVCIRFSLIWTLLSIICIILDDYVRWIVFKEQKPKYISILYNLLVKGEL